MVYKNTTFPEFLNLFPEVFWELNVGHFHLLSHLWFLRARQGFDQNCLIVCFCRFFVWYKSVFNCSWCRFNVQLYKVFLFVVFCARSGWCGRQTRARASTITGHVCVNSVRLKKLEYTNTSENYPIAHWYTCRKQIIFHFGRFRKEKTSYAKVSHVDHFYCNDWLVIDNFVQLIKWYSFWYVHVTLLLQW